MGSLAEPKRQCFMDTACAGSSTVRKTQHVVDRKKAKQTKNIPRVFERAKDPSA